MTTQDWREFTHPRFDLRFSYPDPTRLGMSVTVNETIRDSAIREHFMSEGSKEVYFEVSRYLNTSPTVVYEELKSEVETRLSATVTSLAPITFLDLPALEFSFYWVEAARTVILVQKGADTYCILCDPSSALNLEIRATVEFLS